jgi:hypothetical protein
VSENTQIYLFFAAAIIFSLLNGAGVLPYAIFGAN